LDGSELFEVNEVKNASEDSRSQGLPRRDLEIVLVGQRKLIGERLVRGLPAGEASIQNLKSVQFELEQAEHC
jgi:hypothetical protein